MAFYSSGRRRAIALLLLTSILLLTLDLRGNAVFDAARSGFTHVLEPVESAAEVVTRPVRRAWHGITDYDRLAEENRELRQQIDSQRAADITNKASTVEHQQLLALNNLPVDYPAVVATVVGESPTNLDQVIEIDRGRDHGVDVGMAVVNEAGLVGKITLALDNRSFVMLVSDEQYAVAVKVLGVPPPPTTTTTTTLPGATTTTTDPAPTTTSVATATTTTTSTTVPAAATTQPAPTTTTTIPLADKETGVLNGRGRGNLPQISFVTDNPTVGLFEDGDVVMTAGGDASLAPPGIPVGAVGNVVPRSASAGPLLEVELSADLSRLYFVSVVLYQPGAEVTTTTTSAAP